MCAPAGVVRLFFVRPTAPAIVASASIAVRFRGGVCRRFGHPVIDEEGRFIRLDFDGYSVVSLYLPSGSSGEARQAVKFEVMRAVYRRLAGYQRARKTEFVVAGDINIAHTKKDIRNWRGNQKNSGFLSEEREWLDRVFGKLRWVDAFRRLNDQEGEYTWWSKSRPGAGEQCGLAD